MIDGFWIVQFEGMQGRGGGVMLLKNGNVFGGNSGYTFMGTYQADDRSVKAQIKIQRFIPGVPNAWGMQGDFELQVQGAVQGDIIRGTAQLYPAGMVIPVKLSRRAMVE
jgi:hypothetical protein